MSPAIDLCEEFENPCGQEEGSDEAESVILNCKKPCELSIFISSKMSDPNFEEIMMLEGEIVLHGLHVADSDEICISFLLLVYDVDVKCQKSTGFCCALDNSDESLCYRVFSNFLTSWLT